MPSPDKEGNDEAGDDEGEGEGTGAGERAKGACWTAASSTSENPSNVESLK